MVVVDGVELHYVEAGTPGEPLAIFIHGTPGSWQAFSGYLKDARLDATLHMIAVDRLGFGRYAASGPRPAFRDQARAIAALFAKHAHDQKVIVIGHSLGGSIAVRVATDYPDDVAALVAISSAVSPELSLPRWYNHLAGMPLIRQVISHDLSVANVEMMVLARALRAMQGQLPTLTIPVTIMQGLSDKLVNPSNASYVEAKMKQAELNVMRFADTGHFLLWEQPDVVVDEILKLAGAMRSKRLSAVATNPVLLTKPVSSATLASHATSAGTIK